MVGVSTDWCDHPLILLNRQGTTCAKNWDGVGQSNLLQHIIHVTFVFCKKLVICKCPPTIKYKRNLGYGQCFAT